MVAYKQYELNSSSLVEFLKSKKVWFRLHEYEEDVKTVIKASKQVPLEKIVKSLVFVDSNNEPFIVILQASKKVCLKKIKRILKVKDVRLANPDEVLKYSGYKVGAVPPLFWKDTKLVILDSEAAKMNVIFAGGGDVNKLIEMRMEDLIKLNKPIIAEISE